MCRIYKSISIIILSLILSVSSFAQSGKLIKADKNFNNFNYLKAIEFYTEIANGGYKATSKEHVTTRLGDSYRLINDTKNAEIWYKEAVILPNCDTINYYNYALVLRCNKKYDEASIWMKRYLETNPNDKEAIKELAGFKGYSALMADSNLITVEFMSINSKMSDYSPCIYKDKIIFVSSRDTISARRSSWTDEPFYSLYECQIDSNYKLTSYKRLFGEVNTKYHEGPVSYDKNSGILYFTRNNFFHGKKGESKDNSNYLKIYQAINKDGKWEDIKELPFNNDEYSCAHPAISPDGKKLYFISNMPGGFGGTDIYFCNKQDSGWSKPINLGKPVNTFGNELFPTFSENGILYFASTGHPGLGGLDLFMYTDNKIVNLGYPINTSYDDFGLCTENGEKGFFSSNRNGGFNNDDIYYFKMNQPPVAKNDKATIEIIANNFKVDTVLINVLANDFDMNNDIDSASVQIISRANKKANSQVNSKGRIAYLPEPGFKGVDTLKYVVFDRTKMSDTAFVFIYIFGKNPPVARLDSATVQKNSKDNEINVLINDYDKDGNLIPDSIEVVTDPKNGSVEVVKGMIRYTPNKDFSGKDYLVYQIFDTNGLTDTDSLLINVQMLFMGKVVTDNLELSLTINFETGKWDILPPAALLLDSVVTILTQNPTIEIELGAHTDSRGTTNANQVLSKKRAESAVAYIISRGIDPNRLVAFGYGESEPLNRCKDGVPCSKEEYARNRRVSIKVTKY